MKKVFLFLVSVFVIGLIILFFRSRSLSKEYPDLSSQDSLNDTVTNVISDGRASARVTFSSKKKYTLPWAKVIQDGMDINLPQIVSKSDLIIKKPYSDTIILIQSDRQYLFIKNKTIE